MQSVLIKDTTRAQREEIVRRGLGTCGKRTGEVYRPYIETTVTFEYEVPTVEEFARRVRETLAAYPYLLCEEAGEVPYTAYFAAKDADSGTLQKFTTP